MDNQSPPSSTSPSPHADLATTDAAREAWVRAVTAAAKGAAVAGVAWPSPEDSNRAHAAFYRDHLGLVVLPMPGPADVWAYTTSLHRRAVAEHAEDHGGAAPDEEKDAALWEDAREIAEKAARGPLGYIRRDKYLTASDVTDADLDAWFVPPEEGSASWRASGPARRRAHERPVCFLPGRSVAGLPLMLVDVDVGHGDAGDSGDGDLAGPWGAGLPGPKVTTPRGGLHTFVLATGAERSSQGELAQGVDVVASGGTPIPLPSGCVATPGRAWVPDSIAADNPPRVAPAALRAPPPRGRRKPAATTVPGGTGAGAGGEYEEDGGLGRAAEVFATPIEANVGERNRGAGILAGILARPRALPDDVVRAALAMLAEDLACSDTATAADTAAECARWQRLLTRGPRDGEFLEEVLLCWIRCRDQTRRPWRTSHVRRLAASLWKTCSRREGHPGDRDEDGREACAGAEDFSVGPTVGGLPRGVDAGTTWRWCPPTSAETLVQEVAVAVSPASDAPPAPAESPRVDVFNAPLQPTSSQPTGAPAGEGPKWRGGIDPRTYLRGLSDFYPLESLARDQERRPVRIADVHPLVDFATGNHHARTVRPGYGWGPDLDLALGGLSPGDVRFLGAAGAGAGKTWFECFLANGLALATAERMLGTPGYEDASVVLPVWVTEMPKRGELLHRLAGQYLGFDLACLANGVDAHMAPGVTAHARDLSRGAGSSVITSEAVVAHARDLTRRHLDTLRDRSPLGIAYHEVIKVIDLAKLPARGGKGGGGYGRGAPDHRSGPELVNHVADGVDLYAEELSRRLAIPRSKVLVLVLVDPGQRFSGGGHDAKAGIDDFFMAIVQVLAGELECAVIGTLDTTKYAAANLGIDAFLGDENTGRLAADMVGGSQTIMHNADIIGLCAEVPSPDRPLLTTMWARVLKGRTGVAAEAYPFGWEKNLGRFRAAPAEGLRARQEEDRRSTSHGQRGSGHPMPRGKPATALGRVPAALMRTRQAGETDD